MKTTRGILAGLLLLLLASCATDRYAGAQWVVVSTNIPAPRTTTTYPADPKRNPLQKPEYEALRRSIEESPAAPELKQRMIEGKPLALTEIMALAGQRVNETLLVDYFRATDTVYVLSTSDIAALRAAGVGEQVIDFMLSTRLRPTLVPYPRYYPYYPYYPYDPFWGYPSYPYYYHHHYHSYPRSVIRRAP